MNDERHEFNARLGIAMSNLSDLATRACLHDRDIEMMQEQIEDFQDSLEKLLDAGAKVNQRYKEARRRRREREN